MFTTTEKAEPRLPVWTASPSGAPGLPLQTQADNVWEGTAVIQKIAYLGKKAAILQNSAALC